MSCLDPPCSCVVPSAPRAGAWLISWCHTGGVWIWSCHLPVPRPHLGTALIPKSPQGGVGEAPALQVTPWWGHVRPAPCTGDTDPALGCSMSPVPPVSPLMGQPEGCRAAPELPRPGMTLPLCPWDVLGPDASMSRSIPNLRQGHQKE